MLRLLQKWQPQSREWHKVIYRIQRALGAGVHEYRIDFGPGYRIYFGKDGERLVILLAGGTKKRQQDDIRHAQKLWTDYRRRSKKER
jgi:putative addiction module killer protein